jgi:hypothetical protein
MNRCPKCGAALEWKTRRDTTRFLSHPHGGCHEYIRSKLENRCNLFEQNFNTPKTCNENCKKPIFCFETKIGSTSNKIYFDTRGPSWIKHDCNVGQNQIGHAIEYKPLVFENFVSCNFALPHSKIHFLGFEVRVEKDQPLQLIVLNLNKQADKVRFIYQLHQPFSYKEIDSRNWVLNTYEERWQSEGLLYLPQETNCWKINLAKENKDQLLINF